MLFKFMGEMLKISEILAINLIPSKNLKNSHP